jgi:Phage tail tube protein
VLQGLYQGPWSSAWDMDINGYADVIGNFFRAMIGPDQVTAGVSTTLSSNTAANAATIPLTASVPASSILSISDAITGTQEYVQIGTVTGSGPYMAAITVGGGTGGNTTRYAHTAIGGSVLSQTKHLFTQNRTSSTVWPTYSLTVNDLTDILGYPGCVLSELAIKIDPKAMITVSPKFSGFPKTTVSDFTYTASQVAPMVGWTWTMTNAGAASTRGLTLDYTLKRATEIISSSDGLQAPREIFPGALEIDGSYKAIFENDLDLNLYIQANQMVTTAVVSQAVLFGGASLAITTSKSGYTTGKKDLSQAYVQASFDVAGIANTTDSGICQIALTNFQTAGY